MYCHNVNIICNKYIITFKLLMYILHFSIKKYSYILNVHFIYTIKFTMLHVHFYCNYEMQYVNVIKQFTLHCKMLMRKLHSILPF
jgi:hypothetical protein